MPNNTQSPDPKAWEEEFDMGYVMSAKNGVLPMQFIKSFIHSQISQAVQAERKRVERLISKEIVIAQTEGQRTSRLTSLAMKINDQLKHL